jgi:uncharacterized membrane protein YkvA (DUF1232 family)
VVQLPAYCLKQELIFPKRKATLPGNQPSSTNTRLIRKQITSLYSLPMESQNTRGQKVAESPIFKKIMARAEDYFKKPLRIKELLNDAYKKASEKKEFGTIAHEVWENLQILSRMIKASATGDYHGIPTPTIIGGVAVILYFLTPIDFIPDFIPVIGLLDDVSLLAWFMTSIKDEMNNFAEWEASGSPSHKPASQTIKLEPAKETEVHPEPKAEVKHIAAKKNPVEEHPAEEHTTKRAASSGSGEPNVRASTTDSTRTSSKNHDDSTAGGNVR